MARASAPQEVQSQVGVSRRGLSSSASAAGPDAATRRSTAFTRPAKACSRRARARATAVATAACGGVSSSSRPAAPRRRTWRTGSGGGFLRKGSSTASSVPSRRSVAATSRCAAERSRVAIGGRASSASSSGRRRSSTAVSRSNAAARVGSCRGVAMVGFAGSGGAAGMVVELSCVEPTAVMVRKGPKPCLVYLRLSSIPFAAVRYRPGKSASLMWAGMVADTRRPGNKAEDDERQADRIEAQGADQARPLWRRRRAVAAGARCSTSLLAMPLYDCWQAAPDGPGAVPRRVPRRCARSCCSVSLDHTVSRQIGSSSSRSGSSSPTNDLMVMPGLRRARTSCAAGGW